MKQLHKNKIHRTVQYGQQKETMVRVIAPMRVNVSACVCVKRDVVGVQIK